MGECVPSVRQACWSRDRLDLKERPSQDSRDDVDIRKELNMLRTLPLLILVSGVPWLMPDTAGASEKSAVRPASGVRKV